MLAERKVKTVPSQGADISPAPVGQTPTILSPVRLSESNVRHIHQRYRSIGGDQPTLRPGEIRR
jgi:hypothetical protein